MTARARKLILTATAAVWAWGCDESATGPAGAPAGGRAALAAKPSTSDFSFDFSEFIDCGGFFVHRAGTESHATKTFFDGDGNAVRSRGHARVVATLTRLDTGSVVEESANYHYQLDFASGEFTVNGRYATLKAPGEGVLVQDVGRIVMDAEGRIVFSSGMHAVFGENPANVYCPALAS